MVNVIDTNAIISSIPPRSPFHEIWEDFIKEKYKLAISTEIICEYFEILGQYGTASSIDDLEYVLKFSSNLVPVNPQYRFMTVVNDVDDNKFTDCAIVAMATFLITSDRHILNSQDFLKYQPLAINPAEFMMVKDHQY